jgi:hypothetical protein
VDGGKDKGSSKDGKSAASESGRYTNNFKSQRGLSAWLD